MGKTINTVLNLQDKFSGKLSQAQKNALIFKSRLQSCEGAAKSVDKSLSVMGKTAVAVTAAGIGCLAWHTCKPRNKRLGGRNTSSKYTYKPYKAVGRVCQGYGCHRCFGI